MNATNISICEVPSDSSNCGWYKFLNSTAFSCLSACSSFFFGQQCYSSCPSQAPVVVFTGSLTCLSSCSSEIYFLNGSISQCNSTCSMPFGIQSSSIGSPATFLCSACPSPNFIQRSSSQCVSSCAYVNFTSINNSNISVCEAVISTSCPWFKYLNASSFSCLSSCATYYVGIQCYSSCPTTTPLVASAGSKICISSCGSNLYFVNGSAN